MVAGVLNQLLFLGNRIDGLVRAGEASAALSSAHLALNLLQHAAGEDFHGLGTPEAERLRKIIFDQNTQVQGLQYLVELTRGVANDVSSALPPLWRSESSQEIQKRKLTWTWSEALGTALFRTLRYQHTRFSPTGQVGVFLFRVSFDPLSGLLYSVQLPQFHSQAPVVSVSENESHAFFLYSRDLKRFYLGGHHPDGLVVSGTERRTIREALPLPDLTDIGATMRDVLKSLHGSEARLPRFKLRRQVKEGTVIYDLDPAVFDSNARYARKVLPTPDEAVMGMTMRWNEEMTRAVRSGAREELERLFPVPEIFVSVAENGAFVGFVYQMPDRSSPRGTVYEIGSPDLGVQARLRYEIYLADRASRENVRVPVGVRWVSKPNRLQKKAIERWIDREEFRLIRQNGILTNKSV